jgi:hypothetical protein
VNVDGGITINGPLFACQRLFKLLITERRVGATFRTTSFVASGSLTLSLSTINTHTLRPIRLVGCCTYKGRTCTLPTFTSMFVLGTWRRMVMNLDRKMCHKQNTAAVKEARCCHLPTQRRLGNQLYKRLGSCLLMF